jgi:AraC-like DNA-binding protein
LMGDAWRPAFVCFEHDREADPAAYHRTFRAPVRFAQSMNAIVGRRADFDQPIDRDNPQVQDLLTALNEIRERERNEDIVVRLHPVLRPLLASGDASAARAAKLLGLSPRTLQRRLAERGTTFQRVLDDVRLNLVREHLPGKKLADLAPILGFSEPSAVSRFLRATGGFKHYKEGAGASAGD